MSDSSSFYRASEGGVPVSPSLDDMLSASPAPARTVLVDGRVAYIAAVAIALGVISAGLAQVLRGLIDLATNLSFYGRLSLDHTSPADNQLGLIVIVVPIAGALVVGLMARFGSAAIRGHGIPEAMEQVLTNDSRIPARITFLKPLSAAISIGTGGPFGAEGPIIATGGACGSLVGQLLSTTPAERKTLLAAGAAAGMAATFGTPVSAVLLAVELLLFEFRPRSLIAVALASATAAGLRTLAEGSEPVFAMPTLAPPGVAALVAYGVLGALVGVAAVAATRILYALEDGFDHLPIHWMYWPAIGATAVGVVGYFSPRTLGVGYQNIADLVSNNLSVSAALMLCSLKWLSWSIALASGTSGGTLAPLLTIGGGLGLVIGAGMNQLLPTIGVDLKIAALVGMAAMFAGASRAFLASIVFAFETTGQPLSVTPLLGGCAAAYLVSCLAMRHSIMTEKIARRGVLTPAEYVPDVLSQVLVRQVATVDVVSLRASDLVTHVRRWIADNQPGSQHQGFPVIDDRDTLLGVITRRDLLVDHNGSAESCVRDLIKLPPRYVYDDCTVREAADHMVNHDIGRLPVVTRGGKPALVGFITRSDVLSTYRRQIKESIRSASPSQLAILPRRWLGRPLAVESEVD